MPKVLLTLACAMIASFCQNKLNISLSFYANGMAFLRSCEASVIFPLKIVINLLDIGNNLYLEYSILLITIYNFSAFLPMGRII